MYYLTFNVSGTNRFPVDMLRYDYCFPVDTADAHKIADMTPYQPEKITTQPVTIQLASIRDHKTSLPTDRRWASFGWTVDPQSITTRKVNS